MIEDETKNILILEYCPGKSIQHVLKRETIPEKEVRNYLRQLLGALDISMD
jgi:serine/threonine protein kinase